MTLKIKSRPLGLSDVGIIGVIICLLLLGGIKHSLDKKAEDAQYEKAKHHIGIQYYYAEKCYNTVCRVEFEKNKFCKKALLYRANADKGMVTDEIYSRSQSLISKSFSAKLYEANAFIKGLEKKIGVSSYSVTSCSGTKKKYLTVDRWEDRDISDDKRIDAPLPL